MRIGYLGPAGTFTHQALDAARHDAEQISYPTIYDTVMAVHGGDVQRALVPIENSLEGSVSATLDTLAGEARDVAIVGERIDPIAHCLIARAPLALSDVAHVVSHPQASAQCSRFIRERLRQATVVPAASTADAVRTVAERGQVDDAALGNALSAQLYDCAVIAEGIEDSEHNQTRFVWLGRRDGKAGEEAGVDGPWKTSIVFWGAGDDSPGWLVRCLSEFAFRGVNLTMIESRPRKLSLGHYMFFADLEGRAHDPQVAAALDAVRAQTEALRVLGSYAAA